MVCLPVEMDEKAEKRNPEFVLIDNGGTAFRSIPPFLKLRGISWL